MLDTARQALERADLACAPWRMPPASPRRQPLSAHRPGQVRVARLEWRGIKAVDNALQKGDIKEAGTAHRLLGIGSHHTGDEKGCFQALERAQRYKDKAQADWWLEKLRAESVAATDSAPQRECEALPSLPEPYPDPCSPDEAQRNPGPAFPRARGFPDPTIAPSGLRQA